MKPQKEDRGPLFLSISKLRFPPPLY
jgi:hypothetical protein